MTFADLGLSDDLLKAISDQGYDEPTPIQAKAIPHVLGGADVMGIAQTGTGKTAGFTLPMIDRLSNGRAKARMPRSLIICPTRELATQVAENFKLYGKYKKLTMALLIGGVAFGDQDRLIDRGVDVLIATPGRLLDHVERGKLVLLGVQILVVDEADRMLDMGFIPDVERICALVPAAGRQMLFFSATMAPEIKRLADKFLRDPVKVEVARQATTADTVAQHLVQVPPRQKRKALRHLLDQEEVNTSIIFCNRKRDVSDLFSALSRNGYSVGALHGDIPQNLRTETLDKFRNGELKMLVASDVAARGLDIPSVGHVFNFDLPMNAEDYVHRIGRTGRAGRTGTAYSFATEKDGKYLEAIEALIKKPIARLDIPGITEGTKADTAKSGNVKSDNAKSDDAKSADAKSERVNSESAKSDSTKSETAKSDDKPAPQKQADNRGERNNDRQNNNQRRTNNNDRNDQNNNRRGGRGRNRRDDLGPPVVGLGDHVPAFMLVSVAPAARSQKADSAKKDSAPAADDLTSQKVDETASSPADNQTTDAA